MRVLLAALVLVLALVAPAGAQDKWGPFVGRLIDAESSGPIAGGVVVVVWKESSGLFHDTGQFFDAREAMTGPEGRFEVPALMPPFFNFKIQPPEISYYAPGYATWQRGRGSPRPDTVRLRPLKTRKERSEKQRLTPPDEVPLDKVPGLVRTLNPERRRLWLEPIGAPPGTRVDCPPRSMPEPGRGVREILLARKVPGQPRVTLGFRDGRSYEVGAGDQIPDVGRVGEITDSHVSIDNDLSDEDQDILWCARALVYQQLRMDIPFLRVIPIPYSTPSSK